MLQQEATSALSERRQGVMGTAEEMEAGRAALARLQSQSAPGSRNGAVTHHTLPLALKTSGEVAGACPLVETNIAVVAQLGPEQEHEGPTNSEELTKERQRASSWIQEGGAAERETSDIAQFFSRVVPWPQDDTELGYVNLHWTIPQPTGKPRWTGKPVRSVAEFQRLVSWVLARPNTGDIYYCLSLQSMTGLSKRGSVIAARSLQNVLALKALWLDIDVKEPPRGYAAVQEAWAALKDFYTGVGLPRPSALIASGGGLHVYWISKTPLALDQWRPLAIGLKNAALKHGLRCDACCTVDAARILRVPGTWNCKIEPKRPVQLLWLGKDYDL
jgi:hypothetical protein